MPQLQVPDGELLGQFLSSAQQRRERRFIDGADAAVHCERHRHQAITEQAAPCSAQGKDADDAAFPLGAQADALAAQHVFDDASPAGEVKKRAVGRRRHKPVPLRLLAGCTRLDGHPHG
jgi:hypothetical protein